MAIAYGGRQSIAQAARDLAEQVHAGDLRPDEIDDHAFGAALSARSRGPPSDPDLLIRTGGEMRLSNFLLYESAYAELVCEDALWPDFGAETLAAAVEVYAARRRNFGGARRPRRTLAPIQPNVIRPTLYTLTRASS